MKILGLPIWIGKYKDSIQIQIGRLNLYLGRYFREIWISDKEENEY